MKRQSRLVGDATGSKVAFCGKIANQVMREQRERESVMNNNIGNGEGFFEILRRKEPVIVMSVAESSRDDVKVGSKAVVSLRSRILWSSDDAQWLCANSDRLLQQAVVADYQRQGQKSDSDRQVMGMDSDCHIKEADSGFKAREGKWREGCCLLEREGVIVFLQRKGTDPRVVVCGAGHVSIPIIRMAGLLGLHTVCIDDRPAFADHAREAGASEVICDDFASALRRIPSDMDTYYVIVTRGHQYDEECLRLICTEKVPCAYIGMMGSRRRTQIVLQRMRDAGISQDILSQVHAPIGLSIGAGTPAEIAVSIFAQIIQVKNGNEMNCVFPDEVVSAALAWEPAGERFILATIVRRKGSAPRDVGTMMLVRGDGTIAGTIGGGCAEAEIIRQAQVMLLNLHPAACLHHVSLTDDGAADSGMVCGGTLDVLMEEI